MGGDLSTDAKVGVGPVIPHFLITIALLLLMMIESIASGGANQLESGLDQIMVTTYGDYDQRIVTGTKVTSAIKLFFGEPIGIVVVTGLYRDAGTDGGYCYGALLEGYQREGQSGNCSYKNSIALTRNTRDASFTTSPVTPVTYSLDIKPMTVSGSAQYVRDNDKCLAELTKDSTGTIIDISFTRQAT